MQKKVADNKQNHSFLSAWVVFKFHSVFVPEQLEHGLLWYHRYPMSEMTPQGLFYHLRLILLTINHNNQFRHRFTAIF